MEFKTTIDQLAWLRKQSNELKKIQDDVNKKIDEIWYQLDRTANVIEGKEPSANIPISPRVEAGLATKKGVEIAKTADKMFGYTMKSGSHCLKAVQDVLDACGIKTKRVISAYMFVDAVANDVNFFRYYEKSMIQNPDFDKMQPGTIIVFNRTSDHPRGHIEIKVFGTAWVSDYKQLKRTQYGGMKQPLAVYIPK